jgi:hypothetical protein
MRYLPSLNQSSGRLINIGRRFGRLCTRAGAGAQKYCDRVTAALQPLVQRNDEAEQAGFEADTANDLAMQTNMALSEAVRTAFERCEQHDRENPADPVTLKVFPDRGFSEIVYAKRVREPELVRQLSYRIKALGEASLLAPIAQSLDAAVSTMDKAMDEQRAKNREYDDAATREKLAKVFFVNEYKAVYYGAAVERGQRYARTLFPVISTKKEQNESPTGDGGADAAVLTVPALKAA